MKAKAKGPNSERTRRAARDSSKERLIACTVGCALPSSACLDRGRDGLLVFFIGVVLFRVAAAVDLLTNLLVAAAPVVVLAIGITIPRPASNTSRRVVGQWGGAGGAGCEDHSALAGSV